MFERLKFWKIKLNEKGMTLLEIMIVLVILGGLISVLATSVFGNFKKAKIRQAKLQISEYGKALDLYYTDCNQFPTNEEGLQALMKAPATCPNWGPDPYLKKLNKDPWNGDFLYESNGNSFTLKSLGSDHREGGTGDAADITSE